MRPAGDIQLALLAAWEAGPAPVRVAAERACVGMAAAQYTATRMVRRGDLVVVHDGRPAVLALAADVVPGDAPVLDDGAVDALMCWVHMGAGVG